MGSCGYLIRAIQDYAQRQFLAGLQCFVSAAPHYGYHSRAMTRRNIALAKAQNWRGAMSAFA
jgi:hypothetical protein